MKGIYKVIVKEITELTYEIKADNLGDALRIWEESDDSGKHGEPEEELISHEPCTVIGPDGQVYPLTVKRRAG